MQNNDKLDGFNRPRLTTQLDNFRPVTRKRNVSRQEIILARQAITRDGIKSHISYKPKPYKPDTIVSPEGAPAKINSGIVDNRFFVRVRSIAAIRAANFPIPCPSLQGIEHPTNLPVNRAGKHVFSLPSSLAMGRVTTRISVIDRSRLPKPTRVVSNPTPDGLTLYERKIYRSIAAWYKPGCLT